MLCVIQVTGLHDISLYATNIMHNDCSVTILLQRIIVMNTGSRGGSKAGRKLKTLTNVKKKELCEYKIADPSKKNEEIGKKFGISKSTVGDIFKERKRWQRRFKLN